MALAGAATLGNAQAQDNEKNRGPAAEGKAPGSGGAERSPGGGDQTQQSAPNRSEQKSEPRKGAAGDTNKGQNDKDRSKSATQPQRDNDKQKSADQRKGDDDKQKSADQRKGDSDKQKAADQRKGDSDKQKAADQRKGDSDKQKAADQRKGDDKQKAADQRKGDDKQKSTQGPDQKQEGRVQVSEEKRSGVRDRLRKEGGRVDRVDRTRINVSINVGSRIPRSVRLHTLPVSIVSFAPAYRGYSYILLEDETICIVDSNTYVIVDVIPAGSQRADRPGRTHLTLSQEDMRFIYRTVPKGRTANVRVRLALGAEVPRDVELIEFPADVVERVPDVRRYRYIVTENDIVLVDPDDHQVALVINE
jgi:hypothetical protein